MLLNELSVVRILTLRQFGPLRCIQFGHLRSHAHHLLATHLLSPHALELSLPLGAPL